ncbi:MAG: pitrilysin family protein [Clostridia bacterium]
MYEEYVLDNGLRVITEHIPHVRSVSVGLWIGAGSMHEKPQENGLSHFLEHMLFKGTQRRSARAIAEEMDAIGGQINAFTSKECTCYYAKVMDAHLPIAMDVLCDLLLYATLDETELNKERGVILEEIAMVEDTPEDLVHDLLSETILAGNPLAQPILGPADQIRSYTRKALADYRDAHYRPDNTVLAIAGNYAPDTLRALVEKHLGAWKSVSHGAAMESDPCFTPGVARRQKDIEQVHICLGYPGISMGSPDLYALSVFNNLFGGGMSSRLFQRIREESGLAYSVYSYPTVYPGCGIFTLYAGTSLAHLPSVLEQLQQEVARILADGVEEEEFRKAREQLKGGYILSLEGSSSRMSNIGRSKLLLDHVRDEEEVLAKIDAVTKADVERIASEILTKPYGVSLVGRDVDNFSTDLLKTAVKA